MSLFKIIDVCVLLLCFTITNCSDNVVVFRNNKVKWINLNAGDFVISNVTTNNLKDVLPERVTEWKRFVIEVDGKIPRLKKNCISGIKNLVNVYLEGNQLEHLESGTFSNLENMRVLYLRHNKLREVQSRTFADLPIWELGLSHNNISVLISGAFAQLPELHHLYLGYNLLEELPSGLFDGTSRILTLSLSHNNLNRISVGALENLRNLFRLELSHNNFSELDCAELNFPILHNLDLSFNKLSTFVRKCFENLPKLRILALSHNNFRELKEDMFIHQKIEYLYLRSNLISSISPTALQLPNLRVLYLDGNKLSVWDGRFIQATPKLRSLHASNNTISFIPEEAFNVGISSIDFADNEIEKVSPVAFRNLNSSVRLNLNGNPLTNLSGEILGNVTIVH